MLPQLQTVLAFVAIMLTLSILITALVQIVVSIANLRGKSLYWALKRLVEQVVPSSKEEEAKDIANKIMKHPTVKSGWGKRSVAAIAKDELYRVLDVLATEPKPEGGSESDLARSKQVQKLIKEAVGGEDSVPGQSLAVATALGKALKKKFPDMAESIEEAVDEVANEVSELKGRTEKWFDSLMARASERFTSHVRLATVAAAFLLAGVCQIDAIRIYEQLSSDPELRARVIEGVDETLKTAETTLAEAETATKTLHALAKDGTISAEDQALLAKAPDKLESVSDGEQWIEGSKLSDRDAVRKKYDAKFQKLQRERIERLAQQTKALKDDLADSKVKLVPSFSDGKSYWAYFADLRHLLGMLMTALLLSLGSPFWFNLLRQLASLRPMLAERLDPKSKGDKKKNKKEED